MGCVGCTRTRTRTRIVPSLRVQVIHLYGGGNFCLDNDSSVLVIITTKLNR